ncbi:MAG: M23 family metallopeptidase [Patescibacteria group bacterium]|nr:M23 family metallopeptidase [Patescibacteria group bacterium]
MKYTTTIGRVKVELFLSHKSGRPTKSISSKTSQFVSHLVNIAMDKHKKGHPLSRVLKFLFEKKKIKKALGVNLAFLMIATSAFMPSISAFNSSEPVELTTVVVQNTTTTNHSVRNPLDTFIMTQGYSFFHRGIDLNEETGAPVYPIMNGVVEKIIYSRFAYGNHIIIDHGYGFKSLYAHLSKIVVEMGEEIDQETVIGTVGSTGFSTGSHLHFEVYEDGKTLNPLLVLNQDK